MHCRLCSQATDVNYVVRGYDYYHISCFYKELIKMTKTKNWKALRLNVK